MRRDVPGVMRPIGGRNQRTRPHRRALLTAALAEFTAHGVEGATLEAICARVGVTKGSAYHHFPGKERMAVALYAELTDAIHGALRLRMAVGKRARPKVEGLVKQYLGWFERNPRHGAFVFDVMDGRGLRAEMATIRAIQAELVRACAVWLSPWVASGDLRAAPAEIYAPLILGPSREFLRAWVVAPEPQAMREAKRLLPAAAWRSVAARVSGE